VNPFIRQVVVLLEQPHYLRDLVRDYRQNGVGVIPTHQARSGHDQQHVVERTHDKPPMRKMIDPVARRSR